MNNGTHYEFMKVVSDRFAAETTLSTNASAKKAMEALAAALKEEDRCLVISRRNLITDDKTRDDDKMAKILFPRRAVTIKWQKYCSRVARR